MVVTLFLLVAVAAYARAQQVPTATLRSNANLVLVPTLVLDARGDVAYTLTADNFTVTDNGVPQRVTLEELGGQPLSLVILMQTGGAARRQFAAFRSLDTMLEAFVGCAPHRVALVAFDSQPHRLSPFTADLDQLHDDLTQPYADPDANGAAIFDALAYALDLLKQEPANARHAILLISQPQDDGSKTHIEEIVRAIGETNTAIYSLTFSPETQRLKDALTFKEKGHPNKPITVGGCVACTAYFDLGAPLGLAYNAMRVNAASEIADLSGGEQFSFDNKHSFEADLGTLTNHVVNRYMLSFRPTSHQPGLHNLLTSIQGQPNLRIHSRLNYWMGEDR